MADKHFQATLHYQDGQFQLIDSNISSRMFTSPANFDTATNALTIPWVHAIGKDYQATLLNKGNFVFELKELTPK